MNTRHPKHQPEQKHGRPATAADEVLHEAEDAETSVLDDGERRGKDREAADALSPNEDAQEADRRREA
ncbi:hypothetical protein ABTX71_07930 [Streptomyces parvulus]|uniref:hypothetical protein n=1 Tax=Streptomyces parvulus TaxID=146923 RepID=UPI00332C1B71